LEFITVDVVKEIINEVNIHNEGPSNFESLFNVRKLKGKYNISMLNSDKTWVDFASNIDVYPRPSYGSETSGYRFELDGVTIGTIIKTLNLNVIEIKVGDTLMVLKVDNADVINYTYSYDEFASTFIPRHEKQFSPISESIINQILTRNTSKQPMEISEMSDSVSG
jgi:hypothetical protein